MEPAQLLHEGTCWALAQGWVLGLTLHGGQSLQAGTPGAQQGQEHGLWVTRPDSSPTGSTAPMPQRPPKYYPSLARGEMNWGA